VGFDCSGLVMWAYSRVGISLPHSAEGQRQMSQRISAGQAQPGDLVFFGIPAYHVGIYLGGGEMIDAPHTGTVVQIQAIGGFGSTVSFGRV
jgi:cell wall-associated NlpC family hydrolase